MLSVHRSVNRCLKFTINRSGPSAALVVVYRCRTLMMCGAATSHVLYFSQWSTRTVTHTDRSRGLALDHTVHINLVHPSVHVRSPSIDTKLARCSSVDAAQRRIATRN
jgi:hypothetical protein